MKQDEELRIKEMFEAAHEDPQLKRRLLTNPEEVAADWDVVLGDREVARLKQLGAFMEMSREARIGKLFRVCDPTVCYPSTVWLHEALVELIRDVVIFYPPGPIGYPGPIDYVNKLQVPRVFRYPIWRDPIYYPPRLRFERGFDWERRLGQSLGQMTR